MKQALSLKCFWDTDQENILPPLNHFYPLIVIGVEEFPEGKKDSNHHTIGIQT